jgi:type II secretory pathway component PulK
MERKCLSIRDTPSRRGSALVAAIVALSVAAVVLFNVLKATLDQHRQMRTHRQAVQTDWLATAGIDRAIAQLQKSADYRGETWRISAEELSDTAAAEVSIRVENAGESNQRKISVQADYAADNIHRSRKTKQTVVRVP